jgi:acyl-CoA thioesterase II
MMHPSVQIPLVKLLQVTEIESDLFEGIQPDLDAERVFGGQVLGQALVAGGRTVEAGIHPHSTHARFLRAPNPRDPIEYRVNRVRDGASYINRDVTATQSTLEVLSMTISFHREEVGFEHAIPMPNAPDPDTLVSFIDRMKPYSDRLSEWFQRPRAVEVRYVGKPPWEAFEHGEMPAESQVWMRAEPMETDDPLIHAAALMYASDMAILDSAVLRHGLAWDPVRVRAATLDHGMWFHSIARADSWFLYDQACPWTGSGRALATGAMYSQNQTRLATIVQEAVLRQPR